jgi:alcohol dehydrogenase (NADP+)
LGVSNFSINKLAALCAVATIAPELNQIELHPHLQQTAMLDFCKANNIHLTAYSPLGSGDRPDAFKAPDEPVLLENPTIAAIADRHQATPAQVLLAWAIARGTAAIPKSTNPDRQAENLAAADITLTETDLTEIAMLDRHYRYVSGSFWAMDGSPYSLETLWDEIV